MNRAGPDYTILESRHTKIRRILAIVLVFNLVVVFAKALAGLATDTLSVVAEAAHSSVDALNNVIGLLLARVAAREPDEEHPYGHAKFETLGALAVVAFLSITVFELASGAVGRLISGDSRPQATPLVFGVMTGSALVSYFVSRYEERKGQELQSELLLADAAHTRSDLYASLAVIVGLVMVRVGLPWADPAFTLVVAAMIANAGWRILKTTIPILVDERAVEAKTIRRIALDTPGVVECYGVRSRGRTGEIFAELTITVPGSLDVESAHRIADAVEHRVARDLSAREVVVHVEPTGIREQ